MAGRRKFFHKMFPRKWNWFETILLILGFVVPIVLGIVFESSPLEITTSVLFITAMLIIAKAHVSGYFIALIAYILYVFVAWNSGLFGEVITIGLGTIPITVWTIFLWIKRGRKDKSSETVKIESVKWKRLGLLIGSQLIMGIGYFFLLRSFGTSFLLLSTIALAVNIIGDILCARRCVLGPYAYVLYDILTIALWSMVFASGHTGAIVMIVMSTMNAINDGYGAVNWTKLLAKQGTHTYNCKHE